LDKVRNRLGCVRLAIRNVGNISPNMMITISSIGNQGIIRLLKSFRVI
jgi:hypothetical protein